MVRLGDGTDESHRKVQRALDEVWPFAQELFETDGVDDAMRTEGIAPDVSGLRERWEAMVREVFARATLTIPGTGRLVTGGRRGIHSEYLGHMLAEMQILARSHPGAKW